MSKSVLNDSSPFRSSYSVSPSSLNRSTYIRNDLEQSKMISNVASGKSKYLSHLTRDRRNRRIYLPVNLGKEPSLASSK
jgi:hypothetical protein